MGGINGITGNSTGFDLSILSSRQQDHRAKSSHCWQHGAGSADDHEWVIVLPGIMLMCN